MKTKTKISNWRDLEQFGVLALTGEACGFSMRLLCDVTEQGKMLIERYFGGTIEIRKDSNMNSGRGGDAHVGSIMLPRDGFLVPFGIFCLLYTSTDEGAFIASVDDGQGMTAVRYSSEGMEKLRGYWKDEDDSQIRPGDMIYMDSEDDSRLIIIKAFMEYEDGKILLVGNDDREFICLRSEVEILESSLFQRKFEMHTGLKLGRIYQRSSNPGSKDRNVHAFSGRIE